MIMREVLLREGKVDRSKEHFWLLCLNKNNKLLLLELVSFGTVAATIVEPTEVFSFALQKKASKLILVHNHREGSLTPTIYHKDLTERMGAIGKFVNIPVIDHLIITEKKYYSFTDSGLMKEIMDNSHYDLTFSQIDKLKEQLALIAKKAKLEADKRVEAAEKRAAKEKIEIAKRLFKKGLSVADIASATGLETREVEKLKK